MTKVAQDITEIKCDMKWVVATLKTHMAQHFRVRVMMVCAVIAAVVSIGIAMVT